MTPPEQRVQSDHNVWTSIRLFSRRVAQNLRALIHTGRLRSTVIENFKTSLKKEPSSLGGFAWQCKIYESCCALLDIGCKPDVVMRELKNALPANEHQTLDENFKEYKKALNNEGSKAAVATKLLSWAYARYGISCLKGEILSSHSMLRYIEKLLAHIQNDGIGIGQVGKDAWEGACGDLAKEVVNSSKKVGVLSKNRKEYQLLQIRVIKEVKNRLDSLIESVESRRAGEIENEKMVNDGSITIAEETLEKPAQPKNDDSQLVQKQLSNAGPVNQKPISSNRDSAGLQKASENQENKPAQCDATYTSGYVRNQSPGKIGSTQRTNESKKVFSHVKEVFSALSNLNCESKEAALERAAYSLIKLGSIISGGRSLDEIKEELIKQFKGLDESKKKRVIACSSSHEMPAMRLTGRKIRSSVMMKINQDAIDLLNKGADPAVKKHVLDDIQKNVNLVLDAIINFEVEKTNGLVSVDYSSSNFCNEKFRQSLVEPVSTSHQVIVLQA